MVALSAETEPTTYESRHLQTTQNRVLYKFQQMQREAKGTMPPPGTPLPNGAAPQPRPLPPNGALLTPPRLPAMLRTVSLTAKATRSTVGEGTITDRSTPAMRKAFSSYLPCLASRTTTRYGDIAY